MPALNGQPGGNPGQGPGMAAPPLCWQASTVLVVEDHPAYRILMGWCLQRLQVGHEVVADGLAALEALRRRPFDLLISDCRMPVMDGYAMAREVRRREQAEGSPRVPIIALTASRDPHEAQRCAEAGMDAWQLKPLTLEKLREVLERWLPASALMAPGPAGLAPRGAACLLPTRAQLVNIFGCPEMVDLMLAKLIEEVRADSLILAQARIARDAGTTAERLHRLVGGIAFLGMADLERRGTQLISAVLASGVAVNDQALAHFRDEVQACLNHLVAL